jgi:steroid delta-isomerase-like uncharacterized protein
LSRDDNQAVLYAHLAAENRHDLDATLATVHPDCVFIDEQLGQRWAGTAGAAEHYRTWWDGFGATLDGGDLHWVRDDLVIGDAVFVGRHVGPFAGVAPTGREIRLPFVVFVTFKDGLLAGERFVYDMAGLLRQLS